MSLPGALVCFIGAQAAADNGANPIPDLRFQANRGGRVLDLFITLTGGAAVTLRPVYRREPASGETQQFDDEGQDVSLTAAGGHFKTVKVPAGMQVGLRVVSIAGGASVSVRGGFHADV